MKKKRRTSWIELGIKAENGDFETRVKSSKWIKIEDFTRLMYELDRVKHQLIHSDLAEEAEEAAEINISRKRGDEGKMFG